MPSISGRKGTRDSKVLIASAAYFLPIDRNHVRLKGLCVPTFLPPLTFGSRVTRGAEPSRRGAFVAEYKAV